jgi:hypothetical protein
MQINEDRHDEWRKLIDEQIKSGLSKAAFCNEKGIKAERFYYYADILTKPKVNNRKLNNASEFIPVEIKKSISPNKNVDTYAIRLILKNGIECVLPDGIDSKRIKEVVEALQQC